MTTFGTTSITGLTADGGNDTGFWGASRYQFTGTTGETLQSLSIFVQAGSGNVRLCLFADNAGTPGAVLAQSTAAKAVSVGTTTDSSLTANPALTNGTYYWVGFQVDDNSISLYAGSSGSGTFKSSNTGFAAFSTWTTTSFTDTIAIGTYATTVSAAPPATSGSVGIATTGTTKVNISSQNIFPLSISGRNLLKANGQPFRIRGRAYWGILTGTATEYQTAIADALAKGFNAIEVGLIWRHNLSTRVPYANNGALLPFLKRLDGANWTGSLTYGTIANEAPDFSTPNSAYFAFATAFLDYCLAQGIVVELFISYLGMSGTTTEGWGPEMAANGATKMQSYGAYVANLLKGYPNLILMNNGDALPSGALLTARDAMLTGWDSVSGIASVVNTSENNSPSSYTAQDTGLAARANVFNGAYAYDGSIASLSRTVYGATSIPQWYVEGPYERTGTDGTSENSPAANPPTRKYHWWAILDGCCGANYGNRYVWPWNLTDSYASYLGDPGAVSVAAWNSFQDTYDCSNLVPQQLGTIGQLITSPADGGTAGSSTYISAAANADGSLLVAYIPDAYVGTVTVAMTKMSSQCRARWFNPATGGFTEIGNYANTGTQTFTRPGAHADTFNDWVLVFDLNVPSVISGSETTTQPGETGTVFQNINLVLTATETTTQPQQFAEVLEVAIPTWVATGTFGDNAAGMTPGMPAGIIAGDVLLFAIETANQAVTIATQNGGNWQEVTNSPQGTGTAAGTSATRLTLFWDRYNGTQTVPVTSDSGDHQNGCIMAFRGCVPYGNPWNVTTGNVKSTSSTTTSIGGSTTTKNNCLVVAIVSRMDDSNAAHYSGWANSNLTNVTEIADGGGTAGNGGGIGACCGGLAAAGTYGNTTATNATTTVNGFMTVALLGIDPGTASVTHAEQSPAQPSSATTLSQTTTNTVATASTTSQPTQTETIQTPNAVTMSEIASQPTETATSLQTNTVAANETTSQATQTDTLQQSASVSGASTTFQPGETATALQASMVAGTETAAAPGQTETLTAQFVQTTQSASQPTESAILFQGSNVATAETTAQPGQTEVLSNQGVSGSQTTSQPSESATQAQPSAVTGASTATAPSEGATALQTNSITGSETVAAPNETGVAAQAAIVVTSEASAQPTQLETLAQGAGIVGVSTATQAAETTTLTQPSKVTTAQAAIQPAETLTALQVSSVTATQASQQPAQTDVLQQGALVSTFASPDAPDEFGGALQVSSVIGVSSAGAPIELLQLQATSRIDANQLTAAPIELCQLLTYLPNVVTALQAATVASEVCTITPQLVLVGVRMSQLPVLEAVKMRSKMTEP